MARRLSFEAHSIRMNVISTIPLNAEMMVHGPGRCQRAQGLIFAEDEAETVTVTGTLVVPFPSAIGDDGLNEQESPESNPVHASATLPVNPFTAVTVSVRFAELPVETVTVGLEEVR
jgi:hypothetical protein